jgi:hypothetical protein
VNQPRHGVYRELWYGKVETEEANDNYDSLEKGKTAETYVISLKGVG